MVDPFYNSQIARSSRQEEATSHNEDSNYICVQQVLDEQQHHLPLLQCEANKEHILLQGRDRGSTEYFPVLASQ
jgi:hypothetical protein